MKGVVLVFLFSFLRFVKVFLIGLKECSLLLNDFTQFFYYFNILRGLVFVFWMNHSFLF